MHVVRFTYRCIINKISRIKEHLTFIIRIVRFTIDTTIFRHSYVYISILIYCMDSKIQFLCRVCMYDCTG